MNKRNLFKAGIGVSVLLTGWMHLVPNTAFAGGILKAVPTPLAANFQVTEIAGRITDESNNPLIGVTVMEKGTTNGASTNANGTYKLKVSGPNAVLVYRFLGYVTQEITVGAQTKIDVVLASENKNLTEVIVTALGIKKESKKLGYSAEKVNPEAVTTNRSTNFANALEGKVAGLDVSPGANGPGGSTKIRLRGQASLTADNSPLFVIDGLPLGQAAGSTNSYMASVDMGDNLQAISPDNIETMTVLKGATAAALYGSRASNGAIVITTKSGRKRTGIGVEYTSNFTVNQALDFTDFQYEYGQGENNVRPTTQGEAQSSGGWSFGEKFDGALTYQFDGVQRPYLPFKNRVSSFFRNAIDWTNTLAISGGNDNGSYRVSYSNQDAEGIVPNNNFHKKTFNISLNYRLTPRLTTQINFNYSHQFNDNPPIIGIQGNSVSAAVYRFANSIDFEVLKNGAVDANGNETPTSRFATITNPYYQMMYQFQRQTKDQIFGTASARYDLYDWLYVQLRANIEYFNGKYENNNPSGLRTTAASPAGLFGGNYYVNGSTAYVRNFDFLLGGSHKWGDFGFDATFGGNSNPYNSSGWNQAATNFYVKDLYTIGNGVNVTSGYGTTRTQVNSLYGTAEFSYKSMLYLNLTGRTDWFSVLNAPNDHFFYPSVSGSFVFSELMKEQKWLDFGKLRGSFASVGSSNGVPVYNRLSYGLIQPSFNGNPLGFIANGSTPNPLIKPYDVKETEIGLELHMFHNRVNLDLAAYYKRTTNQVLNISLSNSSGYFGTLFNLGALDNKGLEIGLEVVPVQNNKFTWRSAFNTAFNKSKVVKLANGQNQLVLGTGEFFGAIVDVVGLPLNQIQGPTYKRDDAGNIVLNNGRPVASDKPVNFGSGLPTATGGWTNSFNYKGISFVAHIDYKAGGKLLSSSNLNWTRQGHSKQSLPGREGGVIFPGVNASDGLPNTTAVNAEDFYANYRTTGILDPFVYNSSFIKLRNLSLGYDLTRFFGKKYVREMTLSAVCHNVLIIKKYIPNMDPEMVGSTGDVLTGYEQEGLPTFRTYGFNLNVKF